MSRRGLVRLVVVATLAASAFIVPPTSALACSPQQCGGGGGGGAGGGSDARISLSIDPLHAMEGATVGITGKLIDNDPNATASQYTVSVNWGDGSAAVSAQLMQATVPGTQPMQFSIQAPGHVYIADGSYVISVSVVDPDSQSNRAGASATAQIDEAAWTAQAYTQALTNPFCAAVAGITDANLAAQASDYSATINWGDGTSDAASVVLNYTGSNATYFAIQLPGRPCHTYPALGPYTITTTITDGATQVAVSGTAWIYAVTDGGTFVVGDGSAAVGANATYWGPQWSGANTVSGGPAPDSFKGFAPSRSPICVGTWTAPPGDSAAAPATVPAYTPVLVSSSVTKHGDEIAGDSVHVALVHTDGTPGTGTIVFMIC